MCEAPVYVLTGERGAGKSTLCERIAAEARHRGLAVAGLITKRLGDAPASPRRVIDLGSGQSRLFGSQQFTPTAAASDPLTPGWDYDPGVFVWANEVLSHSTPCDLLVVDEVGPLELRGRRGWAKAVDVLRSGAFEAALVVCRPALIPELTEQLRPRPIAVVEVEAQTRDGLAATLLERLFPAVD